MSEQENETPVWHAWVGEGWEPVLFGEITKQDEEVLLAGGWANGSDSGGYIYNQTMRPRRRRKRRYDVQVMSGGVNYCRIKGAKPGDYFMLSDDGELIPVDKPPTQSTE